MSKPANKEIKALETKVATAQASYDAARSAVDDGEAYAKSLESEYREALSNPTDFDRLTNLKAKRNAVGAVLADVKDALRTVEGEKDDADEKLRHETKLQAALGELSPKAQAVIQAWRTDTLPSRVRLGTGEYSPSRLVGEYVDSIRRGSFASVRQQLENLTERIDLS